MLVKVPNQKHSVFARVEEPLSLYSAYISMKPSVILIKTKINDSFQLPIDNLSCNHEWRLRFNTSTKNAQAGGLVNWKVWKDYAAY